MNKVSIIVPIYNSEQYLERCLMSIQNQTYENIEVIMINDGSMDNSGKIAKAFSESDKRFKYYEHKNIGQGLTRNRGIKESTGKFITFVDSDDYVNSDMIKVMVEKIISTNTDVVCGEIVKIYSNGEKVRRVDYSSIENMIIRNLRSEYFYFEYYFTDLFSPNPVDKLYRSSIIKANNIRFGDNNRIHAEDRYFQLQLLDFISSVSFISFPIYYYNIRPNSHSQSYNKNLVDKQLQMVEDYESISNNNISREISSLLIFHAFTLEAVNVLNAKFGFSTFKKSMNQARNNLYFNSKLLDIYSLKSYLLIKNNSKRKFIATISFLETKGLTSISNTLIYYCYKVVGYFRN